MTELVWRNSSLKADSQSEGSNICGPDYERRTPQIMVFQRHDPVFRSNILMTPTIRADKLSCEIEHGILFLFYQSLEEVLKDHTGLAMKVYLFYFPNKFISFKTNKCQQATGCQ